MGKIIASTNITLDGVVEDPTGEQGFARGGWFLQVGDNDRDGFYRAALDEALTAEALLLGRRTYAFLAARWPSRTGELADRLNSMSKHVVSSTLKDPGWMNTTVLNGDTVQQVSTLKHHLDGEIVVAASRQLVRTLIEHHLVDELRLMVFPFVLGAGDRLFDEITDRLTLRLLDNRTVGDNLTLSTYEVG